MPGGQRRQQHRGQHPGAQHRHQASGKAEFGHPQPQRGSGGDQADLVAEAELAEEFEVPMQIHLSETAWEVEKLLAGYPDASIEQERQSKFSSDAARDHWIGALRKAGLPE